MLQQAPADLTGWTRHFLDAEVPVLGETADALDALRGHEDEVDANALVQIVQRDPLMTLKLLAFIARHRSRRVLADVDSVMPAVLLIGVPPFLNHFGALVRVEERLAAHPQALEGLQRVIERSRRAAMFAIGFAVLRKDPEAEVIYEAALLHDFAEALLWCHAPAHAMRIAQLQQDDAELRSREAQRRVLGIELADLEQALMRAWQLPDLLVSITDDRRVNTDPRVGNVLLAIRVARHSQHGWDNPALPDDFEEIGRLLHLSPLAAHRKAMELDG